MLFVMSFFFAAAKLQMFRNMIVLFAVMNVNVAIKKILDLSESGNYLAVVLVLHILL